MQGAPNRAGGSLALSGALISREGSGASAARISGAASAPQAFARNHLQRGLVREGQSRRSHLDTPTSWAPRLARTSPQLICMRDYKFSTCG
jgi:hypothetical protein